MNSTHKLRVINFMACPSNEVCGIGVDKGRLEFTPTLLRKIDEKTL
jgi:hypothetical protein